MQLLVLEIATTREGSDIVLVHDTKEHEGHGGTESGKPGGPSPRLRIRLASFHGAIGLTKSIENAAQLPSFGALSPERPLPIA